MDSKLQQPYWALRLLYGAVPIVAGADKFFNLLTDWTQYVSPLAAAVIAPAALMKLVGVIEIAAGVLVLARLSRYAAYVVAAWLIAIALNLLTTGRFFDVAARDVVMAAGAFTLARLEALRGAAPAAVMRPVNQAA